MFVATTTSDWSKLRRSGMNGGFGPSDPRSRSTNDEDMVLLRSFPTRVACVAINMALPTELLAGQPRSKTLGS